MARVRFEDGTVINFDGTPTPEDIDFAYQQTSGGLAPKEQPNLGLIQPNRPLSVRDFFPMTTEMGDPRRIGPPVAAATIPIDILNTVIKGGIATPVAQARRVAEGRPMLPFQQALATELRGGEQRLENGQPSKLEPFFQALGETVPLLPPVAQTLRASEAVGSGLTQLSEGVKFSIPPGVQQRIKMTKEAMQATDDAVSQTAHETIKRFRQRGSWHDQIMQFLRDKSEAAWSKMKLVSASIPEPISAQEIKTAAANNPLLANNPERLKALDLYLDELLTAGEQGVRLPRSGRPFTGVASDWSDLSSEVGMTMRRAGLKGTGPRNLSDLISADLRTAIADVLEAKAPAQMKGFVADAKFDWGQYASDKDTLFKYIQPGAHPNVSTNPGTSFLIKAVKGQLTPFEKEFFDRLQADSRINVLTPFQEHIKSMAEHGRKLAGLQLKAVRQAKWSRTAKRTALGAASATGAGAALKFGWNLFD